MIKTEKQTLHFSYKSIGNFVRLLVTIQFENTHNSRDISIFHQRFRNEPDELFEEFLTELYPNGGTIGENEITNLTSYIHNFLQKDEAARDLYVTYDKHTYDSYVYFKPDKTVHYAEFGNHSNLVTQICCDYFKDFSPDEINLDYLKKFILENFEIKSDNTTVEKVSCDAAYIGRKIIFCREDGTYIG